jgi:F-type H+-transporting ATPase subunit b
MPLALADQAAWTRILDALGIDGRTLLLDALAFLVVAWLAERFIYPTLVKALDGKRRQLESAAQLKQAADQALVDARGTAGHIISQARQESEAIVADARRQSHEITKAAHQQATQQTRRILAEGQQRLEYETSQARLVLKRDTAELVAAASGRVLKQKLSVAKDRELINRELEQVS